MNNNNLVLIGFKNSGKSTVGKQLAKDLHYRFMDTDRLTEALFTQAHGIAMPCHTLYKNYGENTFRDQESNAIKTLTGINNTVIASGGGAILRADNRQALKNLGTVVYLDVEFKTVLKRLKSNKPPAFINKNQRDPFHEIGLKHQQRKPLYENSADIKIKVEDKTSADIAQEIIISCKQFMEN